MDAAPRSIAVLRMSALGDVVMTLPLLRTLQKAFPRTKIHWIVSRPFDTIVQGISGIELIVIDKPRGPLSYWRLFRQMQAYDFDWLLVPQASMRANLVTAVTRAKRKIGFGALHARELQR
jgi:heptosyltransferase I